MARLVSALILCQSSVQLTTFITSHILKKIHENNQSRELKWSKVSRKREEFTLTKLVTILTKRKKKTVGELTIEIQY